MTRSSVIRYHNHNLIDLMGSDTEALFMSAMLQSGVMELPITNAEKRHVNES